MPEWLYRVYVVLRANLLRLIQPAHFISRGQSGGGFSIVVADSDEGLVLLDPSHGRVARVLATGGFDLEYEQLRREFAQHVPSPAFRISSDRRQLTEAFVNGVSYDTLSQDQVERHLSRLLRSYATLVRASGQSEDGHRQLSAAVALAERTGVLADLAALCPAGVESARVDWCVVPSQGDATIRNVVSSQGSPVVIDLSPSRVARLPFWYDPLTLVFSRGSETFRAAFGRDRCRKTWEELLVAGHDDPSPATHDGALISYTLLRSFLVSELRPSHPANTFAAFVELHLRWVRPALLTAS